MSAYYLAVRGGDLESILCVHVASCGLASLGVLRSSTHVFLCSAPVDTAMLYYAVEVVYTTGLVSV